MPRQSTIERLPEAILDPLNKWMMKGGRTLDELVDWLDDEGFEISRSALGRHKLKIDEIGKTMRESQMMATALVEELGPSIRDGQQFKALTQMLSTVAFRGMMGSMGRSDDDGGADFDALEFGRVAKGLKDLVSAQRMEADRVFAIQDRERKAAMDRVEGAASQEGWSSDTISAIRRHVLGTDEAG